MAVGNLTVLQPRIWIPPIFTPSYKVEVVRSDGTIDDITDIVALKVEDGVTEGIGIFEFVVPNGNEAFTGVWTGMEIFKYYKDYAATATTLRFRGRIEKVSYQDNMVKCTGRTDSLFVMDQVVTRSFTNADTSDILQDLFDTYGESRFTTTALQNPSGETLTVNWFEKPFWEAVEELCEAAGFDCYIDKDLDVHYFPEGSEDNTEDAMVHDSNLFEVGDFADDIQFVKNEIRVYGAKIDGIQIIYTAKDTASQSTHGIRKEVIRDDNIINETQAQELADFILAEKKDPPQVGEVRGFLLATIQPGERLLISSPFDNLPPQYYKTIKYVDSISADGLFTTVTVNKEPRRVSNIFKDRIETESKRQDTSDNPNDLSFSNSFLFDTDEGSHTNTEIAESQLRLQSGQSSGDWESPQKSTSTLITTVELVVVGDNLSGASFEISADGGINYQSVSPNTKTTTAITNQGVNLKTRVTFSDSTAAIDSLSVLYETA